MVLSGGMASLQVRNQHFEGKPYEELKDKVGSSLRYARSDVKTVVRTHLPCHLPLTDYVGQIRESVEGKVHITVLLRNLTKTLEKWVKSELRTPIALAVRLALLVSAPFVSRSQTLMTMTRSERFITRIQQVPTGNLSTRHSLRSVGKRPQLTAYVPLSGSIYFPAFTRI